MRHPCSFSLIELLIVIAIIGVLASAVIFTLGDPTGNASAAVYKNNVRNVKLFVEREKLAGATPNEVAVKLRDDDRIPLPAKVTGLFDYVDERLSPGTLPCIFGNSLLSLLKILNKNEHINSVSGTDVHGTSNTSKQLLCINNRSQQYSIHVRVTDSVWWCGSTAKPENTGYYNVRSGWKDGHIDCLSSETNTRFLLISKNEEYS